jgi:hypothetical protein
MFNLFFIPAIAIVLVFWTSTFYKIIQNHKNDQINFQLDKLNILFSPVIQAKPYITIRLLEKSYKNKYIKFGVIITSEGVADALMGNSPLDLLKDRLEFFNKLESQFTSDLYNVELVLIES